MEGQIKTIKGKKTPTQGIQTLFRVTSRTQVSLIRIADNKANMIMGINAMIITVLVGIISRGLIFSTSDIEAEMYLIIPLVLIILTSLLTLVYAIRAVKPRLLNFKKIKLDINKKSSLLFFEDIWHLSTEEYVEKMENLLKSPPDIYQNLIIDIHSQAKVLHRKYQLLRFAYTIFMVGLVISIAVFLIMWLFTY